MKNLKKTQKIDHRDLLTVHFTVENHNTNRTESLLTLIILFLVVLSIFCYSLFPDPIKNIVFVFAVVLFIVQVFGLLIGSLIFLISTSILESIKKISLWRQSDSYLLNGLLGFYFFRKSFITYIAMMVWASLPFALAISINTGLSIVSFIVIIVYYSSISLFNNSIQDFINNITEEQAHHLIASDIEEEIVEE